MKRILVLCTLLTTSCMSIFIRPLYTRVDFSTMEPGVKVEVLEDGHVAADAITPASVLVRTKDRVVFRFSKEGYEPVSIRTDLKHEPGLGLLAFAFGCSLTLCIGTFIDDASGALQSIEPATVNLTLRKAQ